MRYFLKIAYDGTNFHGWQRQPNASSIQETIEDALSLILQRRVEIVGAGRTDTGVHARELYAHFDTDVIEDPSRFLNSLNRLIGKEIAVSKLLPVKPDAHARFDAISRSYEYFVHFDKNPFDYRFSHRMHRTPDVSLMNDAAEILLTTEDFTSFAKLHSDSKTNICKVTNAHWSFETGNCQLVFRISADRFLRNMVRAIVGTLLEVGTGKISIEDFKDIISEKNRCAAGISMPANGLFLSRVVYPKEIFLDLI